MGTNRSLPFFSFARTASNPSPYRELPEPENTDAEPSCPNIRTAMIVYGRHAGITLAVCTDTDCPVHDPHAAARRAQQEHENPAPVMAEAEPAETEEDAAERLAEYERQKQRHEAEQKQREQERKAEFERQQKEHEVQQQKREKLRKARTATFDRILESAPATFTAAQLRAFLKLLLHVGSYNFLEEVAIHFATDEDHDKSEQEIVSAALDATADDKLTGFALRLVPHRPYWHPARRQTRPAHRSRCHLCSAEESRWKSQGQTRSDNAEEDNRKEAESRLTGMEAHLLPGSLRALPARAKKTGGEP